MDSTVAIQRSRLLRSRDGWALRRSRARPIAGGSRGRSDGRDSSQTPSIETPGAVATVGWSQRSRSPLASSLNLGHRSLSVDPAVWSHDGKLRSQPLIYIDPTVAIFPLCAVVYKKPEGDHFRSFVHQPVAIRAPSPLLFGFLSFYSVFLLVGRVCKK